MLKTQNKDQNNIKVPMEIVDAVKLIEEWAKSQTDRDDWAIGSIACRAGYERVLKEYSKLKNNLS